MTTANCSVKFIDNCTIRVFEKNAAGEPTGRFATIKTAINFAATYQQGIGALVDLVKTVILGNWRIVVWLRGGRLK